MFTVKVINGAREEIFAAKSFDLIEYSRKPQDYDDRVLWADLGGELKSIRSGEIYIMNDAGKTVSAYRLGIEQVRGVFSDPPPLEGEDAITAPLAA